MAESINLPEAFITVAESALYEITCISMAIRKMDTETEVFQVVVPGMMARVQQLSEAVSRLHEAKLSREDAREIFGQVMHDASHPLKLETLLSATQDTEVTHG